MPDPNVLRDIEVDMWNRNREKYQCEWGVELLESIQKEHDDSITELNERLGRRYGTRKIKRWLSRGEMPVWHAREIQHWVESGEVVVENAPHECSPVYLASKIDKIEEEHGEVDREPITIGT